MRPHMSKGLAWIAVALLLAGCGKKDEAASDSAVPPDPPPGPPMRRPRPRPAAGRLKHSKSSWRP